MKSLSASLTYRADLLASFQGCLVVILPLVTHELMAHAQVALLVLIAPARTGATSLAPEPGRRDTYTEAHSALVNCLIDAAEHKKCYSL